MLNQKLFVQKAQDGMPKHALAGIARGGCSKTLREEEEEGEKERKRRYNDNSISWQY